MAKKESGEHLRVTLRGLTVPGAGVCSEGDLVSREHVPDDLWEMAKRGEHPHLVVHDGEVDLGRVRPHRARGALLVSDAPPPTPARGERPGKIVGVGGEVRQIETVAEPPARADTDLGDVVFEE